ncbi:MAG: O-acetylhomoserine aminocarboxypropyltransferase/cysteine synthase [Firmicutes bacterium]|nr:O-acetylhomoserine aminocarboxypropyltransferase/cysteine synthase [Bacillota bacterium]HAL63728.1 O-acetylhomoserine aminocarboxypropyltransferase [Clostridiales bacterium]
MDNYKIETKCIQSGYKPENGQPRVLPIYQSTTYKYDSANHLGDLFDLKAPGHMYSRISNPTLSCVEEKIADLEGGVGAALTTSGQAANLLAILNITGSGQNFVSLSSIYGGTINLFAVTLKKLGIEVRFATPEMTESEIDALFDENTRLVFGETIANPALNVMDIEKYANIAHKHNLPLLVDNTFATPILCRPFEYGADIVIHSTTKYMDGHATVVGGCVVDSGKFDWNNGKFPELTEPDESYHGVVYTKQFGEAAFITKLRVQLIRDFGVAPSALNAFLLNMGLETLHLRMERHSQNALEVAKFLESNEKIAWVNYPKLESSKDFALAEKYLPKGACGVISFGIKGGREAAVKFMDSLKLAAIVVHVADARTCVLHPASTTHRQLTDEQLVDAGIGADLIRMSVGIENAEDIINDIKQALNEVR